MERTLLELKGSEGQENSGFIFPITPESFEINSSVEHVVVNINGLGEILLKGKRNLREISWSCFFPREHYDFCPVSETEMTPAGICVWLLHQLEETGRTAYLNITNFISIPVVVQSFDYGQNDGTGDINYSITLKEVREVDTPNSDTQTAKRPTKEVVSHLYKWKKGDTWKKVAKKETGKTETWTKLKKINKSRIDAAIKAYKKEHSSAKTVKDEEALVGNQILIK